MEELVFVPIFYLLLFQDVLQQYIPILRNLDEFFSYLFFYFAFLAILTKRYVLSRYLHNIIYLCLVLLLIGCLGSFIYRYQKFSAVFQDILIFYKFILMFIGAKVIFTKINILKNGSLILYQIKLIIFLLFILVIYNYIARIFPGYDYRFGVLTQQLFFSHPTYLASASVLLLALLTIYSNKKRSNIFFIILISIVLMSTGRMKAIGFLVCYYMLYFFLIINKKPIRVVHIIFIVIAAVFIGSQQLIDMFNNSDFARTVLYVGSARIAKDHFPIGAGFGTFGSYISSKYYSSIYYRYGMHIITGLSATNPSFICDTFWPMVIGQFGISGLILFLLLLYNLYKYLRKQDIPDNHLLLGIFTPLLYLLITSSSESSFINYTSVAHFFVIAICHNSIHNHAKIGASDFDNALNYSY